MTQYYRRKQLDATRQRDRRTTPRNANRTATRQRMQELRDAAVPPAPSSDEETPSLVQPHPPETHDAAPTASPVDAMAPPSPIVEPSELVQQAASILNEQMAAGVVAAREARRALPDFLPTSSGLPFGASGPLPKNAYDWLDTFIHWLTQLQGTITNQANQSLGASSGRVGLETAHESLPVLRASTTVSPGQAAQIKFKLHNDDARTVRVMLYCTDLISDEGRIPQQYVVFTPPELQLGPDQTEDMSIQITVPPGTPAGTYAGLVIAPSLSYLRAITTLKVD